MTTEIKNQNTKLQELFKENQVLQEQFKSLTLDFNLVKGDHEFAMARQVDSGKDLFIVIFHYIYLSLF